MQTFTKENEFKILRTSNCTSIYNDQESISFRADGEEITITVNNETIELPKLPIIKEMVSLLSVKETKDLIWELLNFLWDRK